MHDFSKLTPEEIREQNSHIVGDARKQCAQVGAIWYEISRRKLWQKWGYANLGHCIETEGPRAVSTVHECIKNYSYFVVQSGLTFEEFEAMFIKYGLRKMSAILTSSAVRSADVTSQHEDELEGDLQEVDEKPRVRLSLVVGKREEIAKAEEEMKLLSVREANKAVHDELAKRGITLEDQHVIRTYHFSPEEDALVQQAIVHIKSRIKNTITVASDSTAIGLLAGEYLSTSGLRRVA